MPRWSSLTPGVSCISLRHFQAHLAATMERAGAWESWVPIEDCQSRAVDSGTSAFRARYNLLDQVICARAMVDHSCPPSHISLALSNAAKGILTVWDFEALYFCFLSALRATSFSVLSRCEVWRLDLNTFGVSEHIVDSVEHLAIYRKEATLILQIFL